MQTLISSVLSNRTTAQNTSTASTQALQKSIAHSDSGFSAAFQKAANEPPKPQGGAPNATTSDVQGTNSGDPESETVAADNEAMADVIEITERPQDTSIPEPLKSKALLNESNPSVISPHDHEQGDVKPALYPDTRSKPEAGADGALDPGLPVRANHRRQSVAAALVNGAAHHSDEAAHTVANSTALNANANQVSLDPAFVENQPQRLERGAYTVSNRMHSEAPNEAETTPFPPNKVGVGGVDRHDVSSGAKGHANAPPSSTLGGSTSEVAISSKETAQNPSAEQPRSTGEYPGQKAMDASLISSRPSTTVSADHALSQQPTGDVGKAAAALVVEPGRAERSAMQPHSSHGALANQPTPPQRATNAKLRSHLLPSANTAETHPPSRQALGSDPVAIAPRTRRAAQVQPGNAVFAASQSTGAPVIAKGAIAPSSMRSQDPMDEIYWDVRPQSTGGAQIQHSLAPPRHEMPGHIAQQLAQAMHRNPDRPVEIALNPAELGRVRMTLTTNETGIVVSILADRPETLDLMRRNIGDLTDSFSDLGYEDIAFAFGHNEDSADASSQDQSDSTDTLSLDLGTRQNDDSQTPATPRLAVSADGIDLRL